MEEGDSVNSELEEQLKAHSAHFAAMVELIPAKHYITQDSSELGASGDSKYWVNKRKPHKQSVKEGTKKAKRLKLDPASHKTVAELQAEANKRAGEVRSEGAAGELEGEPAKAPDDKPSVNGFSVEHVQSTTLTDLQERLKEKISSLRRKRNAPDESEPKSEEVAQKRQKRIEKRQRKKELRKKKLVSGGGGSAASAGTNKSEKSATKPSFQDKETGRIVFSKFDFTTPVQEEQKKGASSSKKDYKRLLAKAEAAQKKLEELKKNDEKRGEELEKKLKWQKALDMARGTKLRDDPKLLKKSCKRLEKKKRKSAKAWEERKEAEEQAKEKRQQKRQKHIQERKDKVKATKMKKRAKKGSSRTPGF